MNLRVRLALTVAAAASVAIFVMGAAFWVLAAREQRSTFDDQLLAAVNESTQAPGATQSAIGQSRGRPLARLQDIFEGDESLFARVRFTNPQGAVVVDEGLPEAEARPAPYLTTVDVDGERFRMAVAQLGNPERPAILQVARSIDGVEDSLSALRRQIVLGGLLGVSLAAGLGALVAGRLSRPIAEVAAAARQMAQRQDIPSRIEVDRNDEVGDLAASFNQMLAALDLSRQQQQRLVADASHELRTPLTSLRIKIDLLDTTPDLPVEKRQQLLSGAAAELERLTELVTELVDLSSDPTIVEEKVVDANLGQIAAEVVELSRRTTGRDIVLDADDTLAPIRQKMVKRAISNLLDNAMKYSPPDGVIEVEVRSGRFEVRDQGPGIPDDDLGQVFDRFYRSASARTRPGNGIGLAIVSRVAELHAGSVWASNRSTGGAAVGFSVATQD